LNTFLPSCTYLTPHTLQFKAWNASIQLPQHFPSSSHLQPPSLSVWILYCPPQHVIQYPLCYPSPLVSDAFNAINNNTLTSPWTAHLHFEPSIPCLHPEILITSLNATTMYNSFIWQETKTLNAATTNENQICFEPWNLEPTKWASITRTHHLMP
jgi:hypothetical protein